MHELSMDLNDVLRHAVTAPSHRTLVDESGDLDLAYSAPGPLRFLSAGELCRAGRLP